MDQAKTFYTSDQYGQVKMLREGAVPAKLVAVNGYSIEQWEEPVRESASLPLSMESAT
jgi:hypothetical protein